MVSWQIISHNPLYFKEHVFASKFQTPTAIFISIQNTNLSIEIEGWWNKNDWKEGALACASVSVCVQRVCVCVQRVCLQIMWVYGQSVCVCICKEHLCVCVYCRAASSVLLSRVIRLHQHTHTHTHTHFHMYQNNDNNNLYTSISFYKWLRPLFCTGTNIDLILII